MKSIIAITGAFIFLFTYSNIPEKGYYQERSESGQTVPQTKQTTTQSKQTTKPKQATTKSSKTPVKTPAKPATASKTAAGTIRIGSQTWGKENLNVAVFRNGDSIPEAKTNEAWVKAGQDGKPAWCYYNNDPAYGKKYGKLYNWYAVSDPRGLAPAGWSLPGDADWSVLTNGLGGVGAAGNKLKSTSSWPGGYNGNNESGFNGLPGGYRVENGKFMNAGSIGTWWSNTQSSSQNAVDHYLSQTGALSRSNNSKQRGESVRCIKK